MLYEKATLYLAVDKDSSHEAMDTMLSSLSGRQVASIPSGLMSTLYRRTRWGVAGLGGAIASLIHHMSCKRALYPPVYSRPFTAPIDIYRTLNGDQTTVHY